jgi:hypothetical protein
MQLTYCLIHHVSEQVVKDFLKFQNQDLGDIMVEEDEEGRRVEKRWNSAGYKVELDPRYKYESRIPLDL